MDLNPIFLLYIPVFLFSLTFHEFSHAFTARSGGDQTSTYLGRLTFNPVAHIDPIGTVALPLILLFTGMPLFGWAKPVPVNELRLRSRNWMLYVSLAGPASNLTLAFFVALTLKAMIILGGPGALQDFYSGRNPSSIREVTFLLGQMFIRVNIALAIFNMIPVPPLDGSSLVYHYFIRSNWRREMIWMQLTRTGLGFMLIFLMLNFFPPFRALLFYAYTRPVRMIFEWITGV
jgi:Zn-dependent protease